MSRYPGLPVDLVFIRHGESEGNVADLLEDGGDKRFVEMLGDKSRYFLRLTKRGIEQAVATGSWLKKNMGMFDAHFVSDYIRTRETAGHLGLADAEWMLDTDLREQNLSASSKAGMDVPTARSLAVENFLDMLIRNYKDKRVLVVCHATIIRSFMIRLESPSFVDSKHVESTFKQTVYNCQVLWYSKRDMDSGVVGERLAFKTKVVAYSEPVPSKGELRWKRLKEPKYSTEKLLRDVQADTSNPLLITLSPGELDAILPIRAHNGAMISSMI